MLNCAIVGATGYTGMELAKILLRHSYVRLKYLTTRQEKPFALRTLIPTLPKEADLMIEPFSLTELKKRADVIFVCLPHTESAQVVQALHKAGKIVIDLSADFRLKNAKDYQKWYDTRHPCPGLLKKSVYGLPELFREKIAKADLISNPGCYPTGASLALLPLLKENLVETDSIVIDSKSGVTGAGKKLNASTQYAELDENFYAYKVHRHQHTPEILQTLKSCAAKPVSITFVPHLLPIQRGILSAVYLKKRKAIKASRITEAFKRHYGKEPFVRVKPEGTFPALKDVQLTNYCDIGYLVDSKTHRVIVITAIDNLLKGASGQAVQNMNIRLGFPEEEGLLAW